MLDAEDHISGLAKKFLHCQIVTMNNLTSHISTVHNKIKPFKCDLCPISFPQKGGLKMHINIVHKKLRPYKCGNCEESFSFKKTLVRHQIIKHEHKTNAFECKVCSKTFIDHVALGSHVARVHEMQNRFKCDICEQSFIYPSYLNKHKRIVHHEKQKELQMQL